MEKKKAFLCDTKSHKNANRANHKLPTVHVLYDQGQCRDCGHFGLSTNELLIAGLPVTEDAAGCGVVYLHIA